MVNLSFPRLQLFLSNFPEVQTGSLEKLVDYFYKQDIFTYKRKQIKKTTKMTIGQYIQSAIELKIVTSSFQLSAIGLKLQDQLQLDDEKSFKQTLKQLLSARTDVQLILSAIDYMDIPTETGIREFVTAVIKLVPGTITTLLNLCTNCDVIQRQRKVTYWKPVDPEVKKLRQSIPRKPQKISKFVSDYAVRTGQEISCIEHQLATLFCKGEFRVEEIKAIPDLILPIISNLMLNDKKELPLYLPTGQFSASLEEYGITENGEHYIYDLLEKESPYFIQLEWLLEGNKPGLKLLSIPRLWEKDAKLWRT